MMLIIMLHGNGSCADMLPDKKQSVRTPHSWCEAEVAKMAEPEMKTPKLVQETSLAEKELP